MTGSCSVMSTALNKVLNRALVLIKMGHLGRIEWKAAR